MSLIKATNHKPPSDGREKRAACVSKRPKSREETPKEGGGSARDRATALQQYVIATHKKQVVLT